MSDHVVKVLKNEKISESYCVLQVSKPEDFSFLPGQFVMLRKKGDPDNRGRAFSLASSPDKEIIEFYVKKFDQGRVSPGLFSIGVGEDLEIKGPFGKFILETDDKDIYLIGAGSGAAPLMSMARHLVAIQYPHPILFIHGVSYADQLGYRKELERFASENSNFTFIPCVSREEREGCKNGRANEHIKDCVASENARAFICGPPGMVDDVVKQLVEKGFSEDDIRTEKYE